MNGAVVFVRGALQGELVQAEIKRERRGEKSIAMLPSKEITATTGYVKGGCSPIGMKKHFTTVIDASAQDLTSLTVSAGKLGLQITLAPQDLAKTCSLICKNGGFDKNEFGISDDNKLKKNIVAKLSGSANKSE